MRIGIDIRALMEGKTTGVQVYITSLLHSLFQSDQEDEYILFANSFTDVAARLKKFDYPNVRYKIFRFPNKVFIFSQKYLRYPKIDKLCGGLDLFFSPHYRAAALSENVKTVITFHDLSFEIFPEFFTLRQRFWHKFMAYRRAAMHASQLIAVSQHTKDDITRLYGIDPKKISVIYSGGLREDKPAAPAEQTGRLAGLPTQYFLSFGTFEPRKNLDSVTAAYAEYFIKSKNPRPLVLAGARGWKVRLPRLAPEIESHVHMVTDVSETEKSWLYQNAFALLSVSFYEGFGFPMLEAANFGVPVVASASTSLGEIGSSFALLVNPFRPGQIADAMLNLENDDKLYEEMKTRGIETAKKFDWQTTAEQTLALFKKICV